jgi:hypothetical protein
MRTGTHAAATKSEKLTDRGETTHVMGVAASATIDASLRILRPAMLCVTKDIA